MRRIIILSCLALSACGGTMNGMVRGSGTQIPIEYSQSFDHDNLKATMPDGEAFSGKAVMVGNSSSLVNSFDSYGNSTFSVVDNYTGDVQAVLFGDKGNTMRCKLQYADSGGLTTAGGVGVCESSNGEIIDVIW